MERGTRRAAPGKRAGHLKDRTIRRAQRLSCSDLDAVVHASETAVSVANRPCRATCGAVGMALAAADRTAFPSTRTLVLRGSRVAVAGSIACARRRLEARSRGSQTALGPDTCRRYRKIPSSAAPSE